MQDHGDARALRVVEIPAHRGIITDRNGESLAISTPVNSIWAVPRKVMTNDSKLNQLAEYLQLDEEELTRDKNIAIGIAAGYLNLTASLLGYRTGCCQCMDIDAIQEAAVLKEKPVLLMGVGFPQDGVNRRKHHIRDFNFIAKKKQPIKYEVWD